MSARARRAATRAGRAGDGPALPSAAELAAAVLRRTWPDAAGPQPAWRGRAADEALLLVELCRWLEGRGRRRMPLAPVPAALAEVFVALARRGAPRAAVRGFVELVVARGHEVLAELDPDGADAVADAAAGAERDAALAVGLLEQCYGDHPRPAAAPGRLALADARR